MEYRSTNTLGFVHFGGDVVAGVNGVAGVRLAASDSSVATVEPVGDSTAVLGWLKGVLRLGVDSTTPVRGIQRYSIAFTEPAVSSFATGETMVTVAGASTNSLYAFSPQTALEAGYVLSYVRCSTANEVVLGFGNISNTTNSGTAKSGVLLEVKF